MDQLPSENAICDDELIHFDVSGTNIEQKYCAISFISPILNIHKKMILNMTRFIINELNNKINEIVRSIIIETNISIRNVHNDNSYDSETNKDILGELLFDEDSTVQKHIKNYLLTSSQFKTICEMIDFSKFENENNIYGVKIHGAFSDHVEADNYADIIKKKFNYAHCYVVALGKWVEWDPDSDSAIEQIYNSESIITDNGGSVEELDINKLMNSYKFNNSQANSLKEQVAREALQTSHDDLVNKIRSESRKKENDTYKENRRKLEEKKKLEKEKRFSKKS